MGTLVAIDAQNLYYSARRMAGGRVDFARLRDKIQEAEPSSLSIVYLVRGDGYDSSGFESLLRGLGYRISPRTAHRVRDSGGRSRLKYDSHAIRISLDACTKYVDQYDKLVLISGDVDYSDLFAHLERLGKTTEFWSFDRTLSPDLMQTVGQVVFMDDAILQD